MIELVACPTLVEHHIVMSGTKRIANCAFKGCQISSLIIPDGLVEIGCNAFYMTPNLKSITIPISIKCIEPQSHVSFEKIQYDNHIFENWFTWCNFLLNEGFVNKNGKLIKL